MRANFWKKNQNFGHQSAVVIDIPIKLTLFVLTFLGAWTALWAVFSKIPINVTAAGILVPSEGLMEIKAPGNGMVLFPFESRKNPSNQEPTRPLDRTELIPPAWSKEAYDFQWGVSTTERSTLKAIQLARSIVNTINTATWARIDSSSRGVNLQLEYGGDIEVEKYDLVALIDNAAVRNNLITSYDEYIKSQSVFKDNQVILRADLDNALKLYKTMLERYDANVSLLKQGAVNAEQILSLQSDYIRQETSINDLRRQLKSNEEKALNTANELLSSLTSYLQSSAVYALEDARITSFNVGQRSTVSQGAPLMLLGWKNELSPDEVPIFLNERAFAQVAPGMEALITPIGFSASEIGGIRGEITSIETMPLSTETISRLLAGSGTTNLLQRGSPSNYLATVKLLRSDSDQFQKTISRFREQNVNDLTGGYVWNNRSVPPKPPREGILFDVQIVTREMSPLEIFLPKIRELTGLIRPQRFTDLENQNPSFD